MENDNFEDVRILEYDRYDGTLQDGDPTKEYAFVWYSEYQRLLQAYKELKHRIQVLEK